MEHNSTHSGHFRSASFGGFDAHRQNVSNNHHSATAEHVSFDNNNNNNNNSVDFFAVDSQFSPSTMFQHATTSVIDDCSSSPRSSHAMTDNNDSSSDDNDTAEQRSNHLRELQSARARFSSFQLPRRSSSNDNNSNTFNFSNLSNFSNAKRKHESSREFIINRFVFRIVGLLWLRFFFFFVSVCCSHGSEGDCKFCAGLCYHK
jgi:hypothetical protein